MADRTLRSIAIELWAGATEDLNYEIEGDRARAEVESDGEDLVAIHVFMPGEATAEVTIQLSAVGALTMGSDLLEAAKESARAAGAAIEQAS